MTKLLLIYFILFLESSLAVDFEPCVYGLENQCPRGSFCINFDENKSACYPKAASIKTIGFPFKSGINVSCDQGALSPAGNSHTWLNTAFALDLHSDRSKKVKAEIVAVIDGQVVAFADCKDVNDQCGLGFGNQVKIFSNDGSLAFYAHLSEVKVKTGDQVKVGDVIGVEGMSGWTGKDNPHLHFSMHENWKNAGLDYWKTIGYLPAAIPFRFKACKNNCKADCKEVLIESQKVNCKRTSSKADLLCLNITDSRK
tara:strand:- start:11683 stop:12447 length:765 start_codon:yes stop_codon:yes gene_type:complete